MHVRTVFACFLIIPATTRAGLRESDYARLRLALVVLDAPALVTFPLTPPSAPAAASSAKPVEAAGTASRTQR
jgi:hypothetical protein